MNFKEPMNLEENIKKKSLDIFRKYWNNRKSCHILGPYLSQRWCLSAWWLRTRRNHSYLRLKLWHLIFIH